MADQHVGPGLYVKLGLDYQGIIGGVGGVSLALNQTLDLFGKFEGMAQGFIDLANNAGRFGKEVKDNARDLGLSMQQYQQWTHAAVAAGSSGEEITSSIRLMSVRMKEATDSTSEMGKALANIGVKATDSRGNMRPMNDILKDIFAGLNRLPEGMARNQAAQAIFGRGFANIADLAGLTREELQKLIDQAPVFSDDKIAKLDKYNTQMALLNEKSQMLSASAGSELIPAFTSWGNLLDGALQKGGLLNTFFQGLSLLLEMVAEGFAILGGGAAATFDLLNQTGPDFMDVGKYAGKLEQTTRDVAVMRSKYANPAAWETTGGKTGAGTGAGAGGGSWAESLFGSASSGKATTAVSAIDSITDAMKKYQESLKDVANETKKLSDINRDYYEDVLYAGRDMSQIASLKRTHERAVRSQTEAIGEVKGQSAIAAANVGKASGDFILNINGQLTATVPGIIANTPSNGTVSGLDLMKGGVRSK